MMKNLLFSAIFMLGIIVFPTSSGAGLKLCNGPSGMKIPAIFVNNGRLFAGSQYGIFFSDDNGDSWKKTNYLAWNSPVNAFAADGETVYAGTDNGIEMSVDNGGAWSKMDTGIGVCKILSLAVYKGNAYAGTNGRGIFRFNKKEMKWTNISSGLTDSVVQCMAADENRILAGTANGGVFASDNSGSTWTSVGSDVNGLYNTHIHAIAVSGNNLYAGSYGAGVFKSSDGGATWGSYGTGLSVVDAIYSNAGSIYIGGNDHLVRQKDSSNFFDGYYVPASNRSVLCFAADADGKYIFAGTADGVLRLEPDLSAGQLVNSGMSGPVISSYSSFGPMLIASSYNNGVFISNDSGASWHSSCYGIRYNITSVGADAKNLYATSSMGVYMSIDSGRSWNVYDTGLSYYIDTRSLATLDGKCYVSTSYGGIFQFDNSAQAWIEATTGISTSLAINLLSVIGNRLYALTSDGILFSRGSSDLSWSRVTGIFAEKQVRILAGDNSTVYAVATDSSIYKSTDDGSSWTECQNGMEKKYITSLAVADGYAFAAATDSCVYVSSVSENVWSKSWISSVMTFPLNSITVFGGYFIAGTVWNGFYRIPFSELLSSTGLCQKTAGNYVKENTALQLHQSKNTVSFRFSTENAACVALKIFSMSGKELFYHVSRKIPAGIHCLGWNAGSAARGCYLASLEINGSVYRKPFILSK